MPRFDPAHNPKARQSPTLQVPQMTAFPAPAGSSGSLTPAVVPVPISDLSDADKSNTLDSLSFVHAWAWSSLTTQVGMQWVANAITTGTIHQITTSSTAFGVAAELLRLASTGNNAAVLGSLLRMDITGATSGAVGASIANAGVGLSLNVQGSVAFQSGTDYATTGAQNDVDLGNGSYIRYTGAGTASFTGIGINGGAAQAGNLNGRLLIIRNAGTGILTLTNQDVTSAVGNRIITGTGGSWAIPVGGVAQLQYDSTAARWILESASPQSIPGRLIGVQKILTGTVTYTPSTGTTSIIVDAIGGGGGGGGVAASGGAGNSSAAGGGAAGGRATRRYTGIGAGPFTVAVGAAGPGGVAGANPGTVGGDTTFTDGTTLLTAKGGGGGLAGSGSATALVRLGGTCPISTQSAGTDALLGAGAPGGPGLTILAAIAVSGQGGSGAYGAGGNSLAANGAGNPGVGFGAGGGGAFDVNTAAAAGGAGTAGVLFIYEYA